MATLEDYQCSIPEAQMLGGNLTDMSKALRKESRVSHLDVI